MTILRDTADVNLVVENNYALWQPTKQDLILVDSIFNKAIQNGEFDFLQEPKLDRIYKYYRQYICYYNEEGDKIVYVNAFCEVLKTPKTENGKVVYQEYDWKNSLLIVFDGGPCYWQMTINMTKNTYTDFRTNGYA